MPESTPPDATPLATGEAAEAWARGVVEPFTRVIDEQRRDLEATSERIGYRSVELDRAGARIAEQERPPELTPAPDPFPQPIPPTPNAAPWWRRWVSWLASASRATVSGGLSCRPWLRRADVLIFAVAALVALQLVAMAALLVAAAAAPAWLR